MNRFPFTLVALAATYTPGSRFRTDFADHSLNAKTFIDDGNETSDGAGGASTEANAGTDQLQQQAQAENALPPGSEQSIKPETGTDAGKQAIGDESGGQAQQA